MTVLLSSVRSGLVDCLEELDLAIFPLATLALMLFITSHPSLAVDVVTVDMLVLLSDVCCLSLLIDTWNLLVV